MSLHYKPSIDSTQSWAWRFWETHLQTNPQGSEALAPQTFWSHEQSQGKGTQGRQWVSPKQAGLYMSWLYAFPLSAHQPLPLLLSTGLGQATLNTLQALLPTQVAEALRWKAPNDLYAKTQTYTGKLAGHLVETRTHTSHNPQKLCVVVCGLGLNLLEVPRELSEAKAPAISLQALGLPLATLSNLTWQTHLLNTITENWLQQCKIL